MRNRNVFMFGDHHGDHNNEALEADESKLVGAAAADHQTNSNSIGSTPISRLIQERRGKMESTTCCTAPTTSCDDSFCSMGHQSSDGSWCAKKLPPPRLARKSSSDSTESGARKRSFRRTPQHLDHTTSSTTAVLDDDFLHDDELIRQQHEIMEQIQREQREAVKNRTKKQATPPANMMMMTATKEANEESTWSLDNTKLSPATPPLLSSPARTTVSLPFVEEEDDYIDHYLHDPAMMLEQQRLMDEILQQRQHQATKQQDDDDDDNVNMTTYNVEHHHKKKPVPSSFAASMPQSLSPPSRIQVENTPSQFAQIQRRPKLNMMMKSITAPATAGDHHHHPRSSEEDALVRAYGSQSLRIKGTNHTWKAIEAGNATLVQCPCCSTFLQVSRQAKLLYCIKCQEVTPIAVCGGGGDDNNNKSTLNDDRIALVLQRQEKHVASVRKMAKDKT